MPPRSRRAAPPAAAVEPRWERRPEVRPQELLQAALRVFAERGYGATRLEEVAEAAGVTKGALYHYYDTKADLLRQALEEWMRRSAEAFDQMLREELVGCAAAKLRLLARKTLTRWQEPASARVMRLLAGEISVVAPDIHRAWQEEILARGWHAFAALIREGQDAGEFRRDVDVDAVARLLVAGFVQQFLAQQQQQQQQHHHRQDTPPHGGFDMDRLADAGIELLVQGLRPYVLAAPPA